MDTSYQSIATDLIDSRNNDLPKYRSTTNSYSGESDVNGILMKQREENQILSKTHSTVRHKSFTNCFGGCIGRQSRFSTHLNENFEKYKSRSRWYDETKHVLGSNFVLQDEPRWKKKMIKEILHDYWNFDGRLSNQFNLPATAQNTNVHSSPVTQKKKNRCFKCIRKL
ncbi:hypothetical protein GJ496_009887 [Pomphorhynchus laevis]|nr:hypothetical protein GJ496_009887 [Pomphorhynchus laevis]